MGRSAVRLRLSASRLARVGFAIAGSVTLLTVGRPAAAQRSAEPARRVLVLPLSSDFLAGPVAMTLEQRVRDEVARVATGYVVMPRPALDLTSMKVAAGCASDGPKCLALIGRTTGATWVVQVSLRGSEAQARLTIRRVSSRRAKEKKYAAVLRDVGLASSRELRWHVAKAFGAQPRPLTGRIVLAADGAAARSLSGATLKLDGRRVTRSALGSMKPGRHRLEVRVPGYEPFQWTGQVQPARDTSVRVALTPSAASDAAPQAARPGVGGATSVAAVESSSGPVWAWVLGAGALVAAGTAIYFGIEVLGLESDAESAALDCERRDRDADICRDGRSRALIANVTWGAAGALAVGAVIAYFIEASGDSPSEPSVQDGVSARFGIAPRGGGVSAGVQVSF